ncbi:MAG: hypothetical protein ACUVQ5_03715 [Candidatus Methanomethylicaceae archaeon]
MPYEVTKFLQNQLYEILEAKLLHSGFILLGVEREYPGHLEWSRIFFDVIAKEKRKYGRFAVWGLEVKGNCEWNFEKCRDLRLRLGRRS